MKHAKAFLLLIHPILILGAFSLLAYLNFDSNNYNSFLDGIKSNINNPYVLSGTIGMAASIVYLLYFYVIRNLKN